VSDDAMVKRRLSAPLTIAGIGTSAGGIKALQDFFGALLVKTGVAFVVVVHLNPEHHNELAKVLRTRTIMPVQQIEHAASLAKVTRQQFETATGNLRAANEELQSINEEYRSTSEELETSREELQSMNEELQTVNSELKSKLDAVSRAHNDLENLMVATDVGTPFLDKELRIKRFTPRTRELFNINPTDEGRYIGDFTARARPGSEFPAAGLRCPVRDALRSESRRKNRGAGRRQSSAGQRYRPRKLQSPQDRVALFSFGCKENAAEA
jgi:F0F1-type ATP synthase membrane subunit b/b'